MSARNAHRAQPAPHALSLTTLCYPKTMTTTGLDPIVLDNGRLRLSVLPYGLTLHALEVVPASGSAPGAPPRDLLIGPSNPADRARQRDFFSSTVGRYANRLPSGRSVLPSGAVIELESTGPEGVTLHGGRGGLDTQVWAVLPLGESTMFAKDQLSEQGENALFYLKSEAGADGFPCELDIEALVSLGPAKEGSTAELGTVRVEYRARIVEKGNGDEKYGTPVNLTLHTGFTLSDLAKDDPAQKATRGRMWIDVSRLQTHLNHGDV